MSRTREEIKERLQEVIIEEMNVTNLIGQVPEHIWIPNYIQNLTNKIYDLCIDEIENRRRI